MSDTFSLSHIIDVHKGEMGFVCGSGPSLRFTPKSIPIKYPTICVNGASLWFEGNPYYFSCDGRVVFKEHWQHIRKTSSKIFVNYDGLNAFISNWGGVEDSRINYFNRYNSSTMYRPSDTLIQGSSSAHVAVHLAYLMGFNPIVLLGMDCCYEDGKKFYNDFDGCPSDNYLLPIVGKIEVAIPNLETHDDGYLSCFKMTWEEIKNNNPGINIINSSGGSLECFPRVKLDTIL